MATNNFTTPGVYIQEIPNLPPSIVSVPTAIPVFIGYTQTALKNNIDVTNVPTKIESIMQYQQWFGGADVEKGITVTFTTGGNGFNTFVSVDEDKRSKYLMYYSLQLFFNNGGGECYIVSVGNYTVDGGTVDSQKLTGALDKIKKIKDITLINFPDALGLLDFATYYQLQTAALQQAKDLQDRFVVMDVYRKNPPKPGSDGDWEEDIKLLRNQDEDNPGGLSSETAGINYGAVYFPRIKTNIRFKLYDQTNPDTSYEQNVKIVGGGADTLDALKKVNNPYYFSAKNYIENKLEMLLPASPAVLGVYAQTDDSRGVWKAPANVNIVNAIELEEKITAEEQGDLNVDPTAGLSVNVIRNFPGRGPAIIWGARTLAGNDNEWRYVPVRRFFIMVEQSVKNACEAFVFEPNDNNTWVRVKAMVTNYLTEQWKAGALMGTTVKDAFYVSVGLGETMTDIDILEGRMIVQIGMAAVRPAEFIILQFIQTMPSGSGQS